MPDTKADIFYDFKGTDGDWIDNDCINNGLVWTLTSLFTLHLMILPNATHPQLAALAAVIHFVLGTVCVIAWRSDKRSGRHLDTWILSAAAQLFFAVDSWGRIRLVIAGSVRDYFEYQGWYDHRRPLQFVVIAAALAALVISLHWMSKNERQTSAGRRMAIAGTGILLAVFLNSAVSFHYTDRFSVTVAGKALGCGLIGFGAAISIRGAARRSGREV